MSDIRVFVQPGFDSASTAEKVELDVRCLNFGNELALVMPVEGWAVLLDAMHEVRGVSAALDTMYKGIRYGFGFKCRAEMLQPEQPEMES